MSPSLIVLQFLECTSVYATHNAHHCPQCGTSNEACQNFKMYLDSPAYHTFQFRRWHIVDSNFARPLAGRNKYERTFGHAETSEDFPGL